MPPPPPPRQALLLARRRLLPRPRTPYLPTSRLLSTAPPNTPTASSARADLALALSQLPARLTHPARVQLARHNLLQPAGHESIRLAVLTPTAAAPALAKQLLRLALADPLRSEQPWEAKLEAHDLAQRPLLVRVVPPGLQDAGSTTEGRIESKIETHAGHGIPEPLTVASPVVGQGGELEVLVLEETRRFSDAGMISHEEGMLMPEVTVPTGAPGETPTPVASPVHMALRVGEGPEALVAMRGTAGAMTACAVAWPGRNLADLTDVRLLGVDVGLAREGIEAFRESVGNALRYEAAWTRSNVGRVVEWVRGNVQPNERGATKAPVRYLVRSILEHARRVLEVEEREVATQTAAAGRVSPGAAARLTRALTEWSESAHEELRDIVQDAFAYGPWHRLKWWKLFWRADDVGMVASEVLSKRFLLEAEKGVIFLSGRIEEAVTSGSPGSGPAPATSSPGQAVQVHATYIFPQHIHEARRFLAERTLDLQTAAQKLVLWTSGQAGITASLGGLIYLSGFGIYESGSVAALGVVWGLTNLQRGWERARAQWEDEVRVKGRKALQLTEQSMMTTLVAAASTKDGSGAERLAKLEHAREAISKAEEAFKRLQ